MIKADNIAVSGFPAALRGMRNPMNSWDRSDSSVGSDGSLDIFGDNDRELAQRLVLAGSEHRKFLRMINVTMDISAPLYWWKEFDTYKVGTVANSCSTMHKIHAKPFSADDFACEHLEALPINEVLDYHFDDLLQQVIFGLNLAREAYLATKDKRYWWQMIQLLPSSYIQRRTVQFDYETARSMYFQRRNHKLDEWHQLTDILEALPYAEELITYDKEATTNG